MLARRALRLATRLPVAARRFSTASGDEKLSFKWKAPALISTLLLSGTMTYQNYQPPKLKESNHLLKLAKESALKGDKDRAVKYMAEAFTAVNAVKNYVEPGATTVLIATRYAGFVEAIGKPDAAVPYYQTALKHVKLISPVSERCAVGLKLLDQLGLCFYETGDYTASERAFKKAIRAYDKYRGLLSMSHTTDQDETAMTIIDSNMVHVLLHYALLLNRTDRHDEVPSLRQRTVLLLRNSTLRHEETDILNQFDDLMVLAKIREARRRRRQSASSLTAE